MTFDGHDAPVGDADAHPGADDGDRVAGATGDVHGRVLVRVPAGVGAVGVVVYLAQQAALGLAAE